MGRDLKLLPMEGSDFSHTVLSVHRNYELFDAIEALDASEIPPNIASYIGGTVPDGSSEGETMYGYLDTDPYDCAYTWVAAGPLYWVFYKHAPDCPVTAYLGALDAKTLVVLAWS